MSNSSWIIIAAAVATIITRLSVLIIPQKFKQSSFLTYLSTHLPVASFGILVVYSLKSISIGDYPFGLPELISIALIIFLQLWKDKLLVSIFASSIVYIFLVNVVF